MQSGGYIGKNKSSLVFLLSLCAIMYRSSLDAHAKLHALKNLGEDDEVSAKAVLEIREFLLDNQKIKARDDHRSILYFLRSCKFDVEQTKKRIISHYKQRAQQDDWFTFRDPLLTELSELLSLGVFLPLRQKDELNRQIVIIRTAAHNPSKHKQINVFKVGRMILDYLVSADESISVYGIRAIFDMKGIALGHAFQMTPMIIKKAVKSWETYPLRIQKLEFVNANIGINVVLDIFRSFMSAKLKERISVCRGNPVFKATDNLPTDLGGTVDSYEVLSKYWKNVVEINAAWYEDDEQYKSIID